MTVELAGIDDLANIRVGGINYCPECSRIIGNSLLPEDSINMILNILFCRWHDMKDLASRLNRFNYLLDVITSKNKPACE